ncbi:MAG: hypothetical protein RQ757_07095 [Pseudomonadales bacterium]|nr:hypothetical protein [Pseudomonadales bacterium]
MKIYGYDDTALARGDMLVADIEAQELKAWPIDMIAAELGWEFASTRFGDARNHLLAALQAEDADPEVIEIVRHTKASWAMQVDGVLP